ncbi:hypothetical protein C2S52_018517 [Perilla frutescens var. hirtella]|nr:hypothetical protein C2S52_018517 [Perilla frutescens var. hirtella]KAH6812215.1 hypothetical protein C2S51_025977 [Perilla frutescens var. frutescens]
MAAAATHSALFAASAYWNDLIPKAEINISSVKFSSNPKRRFAVCAQSANGDSKQPNDAVITVSDSPLMPPFA